MLKQALYGLAVGLLLNAPLSWAELPDKDQLDRLRDNMKKELAGTYKNLKNGGGKCLDVVGPDLGKNGGRIHIWDCNNAPNQQWKIYQGRLKNIEGNKCMDIPGGPNWNQNGQRVQLWDCNSAPNQQWHIDSQGRLVNAGGKCLDVAGPDLHKNGGLVQTWDCNTAPNQQWRFE